MANKKESFLSLLDSDNEIELRYGAFIPTERSWEVALSIIDENTDIDSVTLIGKYATDRLNYMVALAKGYEFENGICYQPARLRLIWKEKKGRWQYLRVQGTVD